MKRWTLILLTVSLGLILTTCGPLAASPTPLPPTPLRSAVATDVAFSTATAAATRSPTRTTSPRAAATPRPSLTSSLVPSPPPRPTAFPTPMLSDPLAADGTCLPLDDSVTISPDLLEQQVYFEDELLAYLNAGGAPSALPTALASPASVPEPILLQVLSQDVTADGVPEILVAVTKSYHVDGDGEAHLLLFTCSQGQYEQVVLFRRAGAGFRRIGLYSGGGARVLALHDLNRNGVPDVFFSVNWPAYAEYYLVEWNGEEFVSRIEYEDRYMIEPHYRLEVFHGHVAVEDVDDDGVSELVLTYPLPEEEPENTARRVQTVVWAWDGAIYTVVSARHTPPRYRFQAVYDGDLAFERGEYERALGFYGQVIADDALVGWNAEYDLRSAEPPLADPEERPRLTAYAFYRTLLVHVHEGNLVEARSTYDALQEQFPMGTVGRQYADLATSFWQAYAVDGERDVAAGCAAAQAYAGANEENVLNPLRGSGRGFYANAQLHNDRFYIRSLPDYRPLSMCPF